MTTTILIPTLGRAAAIAPLVQNIRDCTPQEHEIAVILDHDDGDSHEAIAGLETKLVVCSGTYPKKTNAGYAASDSEFVLPTADDVWFQAGWLEPVLEAFADPGVHVVGTNDLSPMSNALHATMPVLRRSYVEDPGCSWNEPGKVFHEGYWHNFVETEICRLAIARGVWRFEPNAVIQHRHPSWGTRAADATDAKGQQQNMDRDRELFKQRSVAWN